MDKSGMSIIKNKETTKIEVVKSQITAYTLKHVCIGTTTVDVVIIKFLSLLPFVNLIL